MTILCYYIIVIKIKEVINMENLTDVQKKLFSMMIGTRDNIKLSKWEELQLKAIKVLNK